MQDGEVRLGPVSGSIYYIDVPQGYRVVATLSERPDTTPVRFIATLRPGETVTVSVPREAGQAPAEVLIRRVGNHLLFTPPVTTTARAD